MTVSEYSLIASFCLSVDVQQSARIGPPKRWAKLKQRVRNRWTKSADLRKIISWLGRQALGLVWILIRVAAAAALVYLAREVNRDNLKPDEALVAAGLVLGALAAISLTPRYGRGLFRRLSKLSVGPVGLELITDAKEAATRAPAEDPSGESAAVSMPALRMRWERKLSYIANDLLDANGIPRFVTTGSLRYDGFISEAEERTLARIMVLRNDDLAELPAEEQKEFLDAANRVVGNIRASVLNGLVGNLVRSLESWTVTEIARTPRNDLLVESSSAHFLIVPVFAHSSEEGFFKRASERLTADQPKSVKPVIVVPHRFKQEDLSDTDEPVVVNTDRLLSFLDELTS